VPTKRQLGARIKHARLEQNLTLKDVEQRARVSATHISEIERGMTSPTIGALSKIAGALGAEASFFLQDKTVHRSAVVRRADRQILTDDNRGLRIHRLSGGVGNAKMSFLEIELNGNAPQVPAPMRHDGESLVHVLGGMVEIQIGEDRHLLKEGDSIHFHSRRPHAVRNIGDTPARVLWVAAPPIYL
jgi:transcriptional regulator with XRE-family HTH domain